VLTTTFSLISQIFPEEKEKYISYIEAATGFGFMAGPPLGSIIYGYLDFKWTFFAFAILVLIDFVFCWLLLPK
jgi:MFS family permease